MSKMEMRLHISLHSVEADALELAHSFEQKYLGRLSVLVSHKQTYIDFDGTIEEALPILSAAIDGGIEYEFYASSGGIPGYYKGGEA